MRICGGHVNGVHAYCNLSVSCRSRVSGFTNTFMFSLFCKSVAVMPCIGVEIICRPICMAILTFVGWFLYVGFKVPHICVNFVAAFVFARPNRVLLCMPHVVGVRVEKLGDEHACACNTGPFHVTFSSLSNLEP